MREVKVLFEGGIERLEGQLVTINTTLSRLLDSIHDADLRILKAESISTDHEKRISLIEDKVSKCKACNGLIDKDVEALNLRILSCEKKLEGNTSAKSDIEIDRAKRDATWNVIKTIMQWLGGFSGVAALLYFLAKKGP